MFTNDEPLPYPEPNQTTPTGPVGISAKQTISRTPELPEAGGVVFADIYHAERGYKIGLTSRRFHLRDAFDDLVTMIADMEATGEWTMTGKLPTSAATPAAAAPASASTPPPPSAPASGTAPSSGPDVQIVTMDQASCETSPDGQKILKLKGGAWSKFGVICWPEVAQEQWDMELMKVGQTYNIQGTQAKVLMEGDKPRKVIGFVSPEPA